MANLKPVRDSTRTLSSVSTDLELVLRATSKHFSFIAWCDVYVD